METRDLAQRHAERTATRARYAGLFDEALAVFDEIDLVGISFEDNPGEYDLEVCTVLPRLDTAASLDDVVRVLAEEFERWFGSPYTVEPLARRLWPLWLSWVATPQGRLIGT